MKSHLLATLLLVGVASPAMSADKLFYHIGTHHTGTTPYNSETYGLGYQFGKNEVGVYRNSYATWEDNGPLDGASVYYGRELASRENAFGKAAVNLNVAYGYPDHVQSAGKIGVTFTPVITFEKKNWRLAVIPGQLVGEDSAYTLSYNILQ